MAKKYNPWTGFLEETTAKAHDEKSTIDKAIRNCDSNVKLVKTVTKKNGYAIHIVSGEYGERIVLTFPGENYNNPHMWLGSNTPSNMSKAQEMLLKIAATSKDSKCKPTIDSVIHNRDAGEVDILFYIDIDGNKVHETFSSNSAMNSRLNELKKHGIKRFKTWSHAEWSKSESEFKNTFNKIKGSL